MNAAKGVGLYGVFGGTFNPIHVGHLRAAEQVAERLELERVVFVPSGEPPHKRGEPLAPAAERLRWVERAIAGNKRFEVDALEVERAGPSFSVETLRTLGDRSAPERPVFIVGSDALREMATWREPGVLLTLAHLAVMARPGDAATGDAGPLPATFPPELAGAIEFDADGEHGRHRDAGTWVRWLAIDALDVSATDIRRRVGEGRSIRYLVPDSILQPVLESGCYQEPA